MSMFKRARDAMARLVGGAVIDQAIAAHGLVDSSAHRLPADVEQLVEVKDYGYWRRLFGDRKRRRGYSAKSPQWYGPKDDGSGLNKRLARATGPNSWGEWRAAEVVRRLQKYIAGAGL